MYAIITDGGRQYKVEEGQIVNFDYRNLSAGAEVKFEQVVAHSDGTKLQHGRPHLAGASVTGEVVGLRKARSWSSNGSAAAKTPAARTATASSIPR